LRWVGSVVEGTQEDQWVAQKAVANWPRPLESGDVPGAAEGSTPEASGEALRQLERRLSRMPCVLVGRVSAIWKARPRHRRARSPVDLSKPNPRGLIEGLRFAMDHGALESVASLLETARATGYDAERGADVACLLEALLVIGQRDQAVALAAARRSSLLLSPQGTTLLELLGQPGPDRLPGGSPNLLGLSLRCRQGQLDADGLAQIFADEAWRWLRLPELQLLFFSALWRERPTSAVPFLNRFLSLCGARDTLRLVSAEGAHVLAQLAGNPLPSYQGPLVSIVVAARDAESTLPFAIESLLAQSYRQLEILIGDDASSDGTERVMARYAADPRVRCFRSTRNQGAYNLRNALAREARGALLAFHDADDFALPSRIQTQVGRLARTGASGSVTSLLRVRPDGGVVFFKDQKATRLSRVSLLLTRQAFREVGPFRSAKIGADEELHARLGERFGPRAIQRISLPLSLCSWASTSITRGMGSESLEDGYRSPARRAYSELLFQRYRAGRRITDELFDARLRETENYLEPGEIVEI
jgi:hypothetical protein